MWHFDWITGGSANIPDDMAQRWDSAFEEKGNIWQCRQFAFAWENLVAPRRNEKPILLHAQDISGHELVYPLFWSSLSKFCVPRIEIMPLGGMYYCDYQDPLSIAKPMCAADHVNFWHDFERFFKRRDWKRFGLFSRFTTFRLLREPPSPIKGLDRQVAPYIPVCDYSSLDDLLASRGKKLRTSVQRGLRQLRDRGCEEITPVNPSRIRDVMNDFCRNYRQQWGRDGRNNLDEPGTQEFWTELAVSASRLGKLHFSTLEVAGDTWHWHLGFRHRKNILWYKPTYNLEFAKYSPGLLHLALIVEEAIGRGDEVVDLGYGSEPYKYKWTDDVRSLFPYQIEHLGGTLALARGVLGLRRARSA